MNIRTKLVVGILSAGLLAAPISAAAQQRATAGTPRQPMMRTTVQGIMRGPQGPFSAGRPVFQESAGMPPIPTVNHFTNGLPPVIFGRAVVMGVQRSSIAIRTHTGLTGTMKVPSSAIRALRLRAGSMIVLSRVRSNPRFIRIQLLRSQGFCQSTMSSPARQTCLTNP